MGKMKIWDPEEFVVQMLRTLGGLIMIGGEFAFFMFFRMRGLITERKIIIAATFACDGASSSRGILSSVTLTQGRPYACVET